MKSLIALGTLLTSTVFAVAVVACGSGSTTTNDAPDGGTDGGGTSPEASPVGPVTGGSSLKLVAPLSAKIAVGRTTDIAVTRQGDTSHAVAISLTGLPAGVTAMDGTIDANKNNTVITLTADSSAVPNATPATVTVKGLSPVTNATTTFPLTVQGAPGSLDQSWGVKGLTAGLTEAGSQATGIGVQKSGAVVVGGYVNNDLVVARYTTAGVLDPTFGTAGQTRTAPPGSDSRLVPTTNLVVLANDSLVIGGQFHAAANLSFPARFTAGGAPDTTFGASGFGSSRSGGAVAAVGADGAGNVLMAGFTFVNRQSSTGVVDTNFGSSGIALPATSSARALAFQSSGRVLCAGLDTNGPSGFTSAFNPTDGTLDGTFGTSGTLGGVNAHDWRALAADKADALYAAGQESGTKFVVGKITKNGTVDLGFGGGVFAIALGDAGQASQANGVAVQADGKVVAVGTAVQGGHPVMAVVRLLPSGALDTSFGKDGNGIVLLPTGAANGAANAVAIQPDGKILVAGHGDQDWTVARFWP